MQTSVSLSALVLGLIGTLAVPVHAAPAKPRKIPGLHKVGDITLKRGVVKMQARPARQAASQNGQNDVIQTEILSLGFSFPARPMAGDDVAFTCTGDFPSRLEVAVTHDIGGKRGRPTKHTLEPEDGRVEFIVGTAKLNRGIVHVAVQTQSLGACTLKREKVEGR